MSGNAKIRWFLLAPIVLALLFVVSSPVVSWASETGYVDIQAAVTGTKEWKKEFASFKAKFQQEKVVIATKEKNLKKMIENLNKQSMVLSPELKRKREEALLKKKKEFERHVLDKNDEFAKIEKAITNKILKKMVKIVKDLGESKKFTMILEKKVGLYFDQSVDLTALATRTYNKTK